MYEKQLIDRDTTGTTNRQQKQIFSGDSFLDEKEFDQPKQDRGTENAKEDQYIWGKVVGHDTLGNHMTCAIQSIHCKKSNVGAKNVVHTYELNDFTAASTVLFAFPMKTSSPLIINGRFKKVYSSSMYFL